jgi:hypothetical protein
MKRAPWTVLVAAGLALAIPTVSAQTPAPPAAPAPAPPGQGTIIQQIIVKVNGDIFTKTDLEGLQIDELRRRNLVVDPTSSTTLPHLATSVTLTGANAIANNIKINNGGANGNALVVDGTNSRVLLPVQPS